MDKTYKNGSIIFWAFLFLLMALLFVFFAKNAKADYLKSAYFTLSAKQAIDGQGGAYRYPTVNFDTEITTFDNSLISNPTATSTSFVIPESGYYIIEYSVVFENTSTNDHNSWLYINGDYYSGGNIATSTTQKFNAYTSNRDFSKDTQIMLYLNENDTLSLVVYQNTTGSKNLIGEYGNTYFFIQYLFYETNELTSTSSTSTIDLSNIDNYLGGLNFVLSLILFVFVFGLIVFIYRL